jgi:hypothetical protein
MIDRYAKRTIGLLGTEQPDMNSKFECVFEEQVRGRRPHRLRQTATRECPSL